MSVRVASGHAETLKQASGKSTSNVLSLTYTIDDVCKVLRHTSLFIDTAVQYVETPPYSTNLMHNCIHVGSQVT